METYPYSWDRWKWQSDNWLIIPAFGVEPADTDFQGFKYPIIGPKTQPGDNFENELVLKMGLARNLLRSKFATYQDALESLGVWKEDMTERELDAFCYFSFVNHMRVAIEARGKSADQKAFRIMMGMSLLTDWALGVHTVPWELAVRGGHHQTVQRMLVGASIGGKKGAATRRAKAKVPSPSELRVERDRLIASGAELRTVAGRLASRYGVTADHIRKTLEKQD